MSAIKPVIREVKQAVLTGLARMKDKLHGLADNLADFTDDVVRQVRGQDHFDPPTSAVSGGGGPRYEYGVRFFGEEQLPFYTADNATLGPPNGAPQFLMPLEDAGNVHDAMSAAIETGMAPSVTNAWRNGERIYGAMIPIDHLPQRLPTAADAGGFEHFYPNGRTAIMVGGEHFGNTTREIVVPSGSSLRPGTTVFELLDGGVWDMIGIHS